MRAGPRPPRLHYGWVVAGVTLALLAVAAGARSAPTMLIRPLEGEFGWTTGTISLAIGINIALFGLGGPFGAGLMDRFGVRRLAASALAMLGTAWAMTLLVHAPWQLVLVWGVGVGGVSGLLSAVFGAVIANRWFEARRGLVSGIFGAANATGQLIFLPIFGYLVTGPGWRACALAVAAACVLLLPAVLLLRDRPADVGLSRVGARGPDPLPPPMGNPFARAFQVLGEAVRVPVFWIAALSFMACGASTNGLIGTHFVPICGDHGIPEVRAAGLLMLIGVFDIAGTTLSGWLTDRMNPRILLAAVYGLRAVALSFLPTAFGIETWGLPLFAVIYGLDWIATLPPTLKLVNEEFGTQKGGVVFGWLFAIHQVGSGLTAFGAGETRTLVGDYGPALMVAVAMCAAASIMFLVLRTGSRQSLAERTA